jgi:hypothetical protein
MADFKVIRDRDAWAAIRGFVYQVDQTLLDWLSLEPSMVLELEKGEDIDLVLPAFEHKAESSRQLKQIKYLNRNISLKTPHVLEALASFHEHITNNPALHLSLCFITNSGSTVERPSPIESGESGIDVWTSIQSNTLPIEKYYEAITGLRSIVGNATKPRKFAAETWQKFIQFVRESTYEDLLGFVRRVEWRLRSPDNESIRSVVQESIRSLLHLGQERAEGLYFRLFVHVIRLLSQKGPKRLTREDLEHLSASDDLNTIDLEVLAIVRSLLFELDSRVASIESGYLAHEERLNLIQAEVNQIANSFGVATSVNYGSEVLDLDPPPLSDTVVRRVEIVRRYLQTLNDVTWTAVYGEVGSGKTQLALLIVSALGRPIAWVRFRGLSPAQACSRLDQVLGTLSNTSVGANWQRWCQQACSLLPKQTTLVVDDLPRVRHGELLFERLMLVARTFASHKLQLVSTSAFDLPASFKKLGENGLISVTEIPKFDDDEIQELLRLHGAPETFVENSLRLVASLSRRHPTLLNAMSTYLAGREWRLSKEDFDNLIRGEYAGEANEQTAASLLNTLPDPNARNLLYRLNLIIGRFTDRDIRTVSTVTPSISHPFEKIAESIGLWVQRDSRDSYVLSPLVQQLGSQNLAPETLNGVHLALAKEILSKKQIDGNDLASTIHHYLGAGEHNQAARTLLWALASMSSQKLDSDPWGLSSYWYGIPLPEEIDLDLRIHLRALQAQVGEQLQKSTAYILNDLDRLLDTAGLAEARAITHATIVAGPLLMDSGLERANRYLLKFLSLVPDNVLPDGTALTFPSEISGPSLIWATVRMVQTKDDITNWFATLSQFTQVQIAQALRAPMAPDGAMAIADRLWLWEARKEPKERDWDTVLDQLREVTTVARRIHTEILWACLIRSQMIVLGEYKLDVEAALVLGNQALSIASSNPDIQSLLKMTIGNQMIYADRRDEGTKFLYKSINEPAKCYPLLRTEALLKIAREVGSADIMEALTHIDQAVELARQRTEVPESELIKAFGEKAIAHWLNDDLNSCYEPLAEGAERLLDHGQEDDEAKILFALFAHVSGFLMHLAVTGEEILEISDGSPFKPPELGMFLKAYPDVISYYRKEYVCILPTQIAYFARSLGRQDDLATWSQRAMIEAKRSGNDSSLTQISHLVLDVELSNFKIPEAIDAAVQTGMAMAAFEIEIRAGRSDLRKDLNILEILGPRQGDAWRAANRIATTFSFLPIFLQLARRRLESNEDLSEQLETLSSVCEQVAATSSEPEVWREGASLMRAIIESSVSAEELMRRAPQYSSDALQALTFLGASLETFPEQAVHNQLETMPTIIDATIGLRSTFSRVVIPFYKSFWVNSLRHNRFRYRVPGMVEQELNALLSSDEWTVVPQILNLMSSSLGVEKNNRVKEWLDQKLLSQNS